MILRASSFVLHRPFKLLILAFVVAVWVVSLERYLVSSNRPIPLHYQFTEESIEYEWTRSNNSFAQLPRNDTGSTRFLAYLPHSGFHNQRIELENAIVLSILLKRTLVLPLARLGSHPLPYKPFDELFEQFGRSDKSWLPHCRTADMSANSTVKECRKFERYTHLSWQDLISVPLVKESVGFSIIERWDFRSSWFEEVLGTSSEDIYWVKDSSPYEFRFHDGDTTGKSRGKYQSFVGISELDRTSRSHKLLHLGTLFGTSRLYLSSPGNRELRRNVRATMRYQNRFLERLADRIVNELGGSNTFFGVHLRVGDGLFLERAKENARLLWSVVLTRFYGVHQHEFVYAGRNASSTPTLSVFPSVLPIQTPFGRPIPCKSPKNTKEEESRWLRSLQSSLFIATDARNPRIHPVLELFRSSFPCVVFLSDFEDTLGDLRLLRNPLDDSPMEKFLLPFVDAMVVSRAAAVMGTPESTFSRYIEEVLWPLNHGFNIRSNHVT
ncbi:hypothetical protein FRC18_009207 [Serendipita sp. 400]|nr:hypothetical protein FRC18_009207 [Serendipita sp. 400]